MHKGDEAYARKILTIFFCFAVPPYGVRGFQAASSRYIPSHKKGTFCSEHVLYSMELDQFKDTYDSRAIFFSCPIPNPGPSTNSSRDFFYSQVTRLRPNPGDVCLGGLRTISPAMR